MALFGIKNSRFTFCSAIFMQYTLVVWLFGFLNFVFCHISKNCTSAHAPSVGR